MSISAEDQGDEFQKEEGDNTKSSTLTSSDSRVLLQSIAPPNTKEGGEGVNKWATSEETKDSDIPSLRIESTIDHEKWIGPQELFSEALYEFGPSAEASLTTTSENEGGEEDNDDRTLLDVFGEISKEYLTQRVVCALFRVRLFSFMRAMGKETYKMIDSCHMLLFFCTYYLDSGHG